MTTMNCEQVRDLYPDVLHGNADVAMVTRVRAHIASCEECSAEAALLDAIYSRTLQVPVALEASVARAVRTTKPRMIGRSQLAMAATLAFALIGGTAILRMQKDADAPQASAPAAAPHIGAVGVEDAMLSGKTSLDDLSVEQLQKLLGEIES